MRVQTEFTVGEGDEAGGLDGNKQTNKRIHKEKERKRATFKICNTACAD